jgi:hypothetical protein
MGRDAAHAARASGSGGDSVAGIQRPIAEAMVKACGVAMAMLPGYSPGGSLVDRVVVNVGPDL